MEVRLQRLERNVAKTGNDDALIQSFINIRNTARSKKDYVTADEIRKILKDNKIELEDRNDGTTKWWRAG